MGLVGTGYWAKVIHGASIAQHPRIELVGVWGRDASKRSVVADDLGTRAFADFESLLDDVEALSFAVPPDVQAALATRAAESGRHLLLEKPIATSVADAQRLERAATDARVASIVFFTRRFRPATQAWLARVLEQDGWHSGRAEIAANVFIEGNPFGASPWRREKGALWDVGPHALSVLLPVLGDVRSVVAGSGRGDQVHLVLQHAEGRSSTASLSMTAPEAATGSTLYFDGELGRETAPPGSSDPADIVTIYRRALDALLDQIGQPDPGHPCDVHFGARVVEILAGAEQSLATGCAVQLS
jgi:predicted dehydrogenase